MEKNDGVVFTWNELPFITWLKHTFKVESESAFWKFYHGEFDAKFITRVDREPTLPEENEVGTAK